MLQRPELAVYIARIATAWSGAEQRLGFLIVQILGAQADTGMRMYQALSGAASQKAVLRAVARHRLQQDMLDELEDILSDYKKAAGRRNNVIHGHWDVSESHLNELAWCDPGEYLQAHSEFWAGYHSQPDDAVMDWLRAWKGERPTYLLYNKTDFEEILEAIRLVIFRIMDFNIRVQGFNKARADKAGLGGR